MCDSKKGEGVGKSLEKVAVGRLSEIDEYTKFYSHDEIIEMFNNRQQPSK
jgi:hypothetical protein